MDVRGIALAGLTVTLFVPPAAGQGAWFGAGAGVGAAKVSCALCRSDLDAGPSLQVRAGGTLGAGFRIGVEGNGWLKSDPEADVRNLMLGIGGVVYWYPAPGGRYYLKAGLGPVFYRVEEREVDPLEEPDPALTSTAFAGHFGVGYDLPAGPVVVAPFFNFTGSLYGNLYRENTRVADVSITLVQLGVGVSWR